MSTLINPNDHAQIRAVDAIESQHPEPHVFAGHERSLQSVQVERPIAADCNTQFHAQRSSGVRPLTVLDLIVMHATQGGTSRSVASWFADPDSQGSAQLVVDDFDCYRCLRDDEIPWGAPGANYHGFHIEQCGWTSWLATMWNKTHRKTLMRAAFKTALHCKRYDIQMRFLTSDKLKQGIRNGITTHAECTKAFGGDHTDPGTGWPRLLFMTMVRGYALTPTVRKGV